MYRNGGCGVKRVGFRSGNPGPSFWCHGLIVMIFYFLYRLSPLSCPNRMSKVFGPMGVRRS